jgi:pilus assembly protein CpaF
MIQTDELYDKVLERLDLSKEVDDRQLEDLIHEVLEEVGRENYLSLKEKAVLGRELFNAFRKLDILQELIEDEEITEIMINGTDHIFIEKDGEITRLSKRFVSKSKLEDLIQQMVANANRIVNEASPIVDARLADGSRVNVVLAPVAINGPIVTIRKFPKEVMTMEELIRRESVNREIVEFLEKLVVAKYNIFVSGGTGSG